MVYLGVDPGLQYAGFGIAKKEAGGKIYLLEFGYLRLPQIKSVPQRLEIFYDYFLALSQRHQVEALILETPFLGKNAQNFLKLGYLRGILYLIAMQNKLQISEFTPQQVKLALTGYGGASKEQVAKVISQLFPKINGAMRSDITDALAVTLCGIWRSSNSKAL